MTQYVITNAGIAAAVAAGAGGIKVEIDHFKIGSVAGFAVDATATDIRGLVYTGSTSQLTYHIVNDDSIVYHIDLDQLVGDFDIGNIGLYLTDGTLFSIGVLDAATQKRKANQPTTIGNRKTFDFLTVFSNLANITNLSILLPNECSLPSVADQTMLPDATTSIFDAYIVKNYTVYGAPAVAIAVEGVWYYALYNTDPQTTTSVLLFPPALFASNVAIGNTCYWNAADNQFERGDGLNGAIGVLGVRTSLNTITIVGKYVDAGTPFTAGAQYYADGGANAGKLTKTVTNVYIGYARTTSELLININYNTAFGANLIDVIDGNNASTADNFVGASAPGISGYNASQVYEVTAPAGGAGNTTTTPKLNVSDALGNALGAMTLTRRDGSALAAGDIKPSASFLAARTGNTGRILGPVDSEIVALINANAPKLVAVGPTIYVAPPGTAGASDANPGTLAQPLATLAAAFRLGSSIFVIGGQVTIKLTAAGTYAAASPPTGSLTPFVVQGDINNAANYILAGTNTSTGVITLTSSGSLQLVGVTILNTGNVVAHLGVAYGGNISLNYVGFASTSQSFSQALMTAFPGGNIILGVGQNVITNFGIAFNVQGGAIAGQSGSTFAFNGGAGCTTATAYVDSGLLSIAGLNFAGSTVSGSAPRYIIASSAGRINVGGAGVNFIPGGAAGTAPANTYS